MQSLVLVGTWCFIRSFVLCCQLLILFLSSGQGLPLCGGEAALGISPARCALRRCTCCSLCCAMVRSVVLLQGFSCGDLLFDFNIICGRRRISRLQRANSAGNSIATVGGGGIRGREHSALFFSLCEQLFANGLQLSEHKLIRLIYG